MEDRVGAFVPHGLFELAGATTGPLAGRSFAAKDIIDVAGRVSGCGNPDWLRTHDSAPATATTIQRCPDAGATLRGKTVTEELATGLTGENTHYGTPLNANAPGHVSGGSSSGSASAVAAGLVDFALGSDTGGSVRAPASFCGIYGIRPTHGRVPMSGVMPLAPSLDVVGWFARTPDLLAAVNNAFSTGRPGHPHRAGFWSPQMYLLCSTWPHVRPWKRLLPRLKGCWVAPNRLISRAMLRLHRGSQTGPRWHAGCGGVNPGRCIGNGLKPCSRHSDPELPPGLPPAPL